MKEFFAYLVTNTITGKCYVGVSAKSVENRWAAHVHRANSKSKDGKYALHLSISKYGSENFTIVHIASSTSWKDILATERTLITQWGSKRPYGYNLTDGGDGTLGHKMTDEQRAKISAMKIGFKHTEQTRIKIGIASKLHEKEKREKKIAEFGPPPPKRTKEEALAKQKESYQKWRRENPEKVSALIAKRTGKTRTLDTRRKMSVARLGIKLSAETRAKMSAAKTGVIHSKSALEKFSAKKIEWWANPDNKARIVKRWENKAIDNITSANFIRHFVRKGVHPEVLATELKVDAALIALIIAGKRWNQTNSTVI